MKGLGTILNVATVLVGAGLGKFFGDRLPEKIRETVMHALGLMTVVIGVKMALETNNILIVLGSLLLGGIIGEIFRIDDLLHSFAHWAGAKLKASESTFAEGFITASLVFCVGPMTIMGSIQDGISGDFKLLAIKSMLDGFAALAFASTLGWGVSFAAVTVLVYQGGLTILSSLVGSFFTSAMVAEMTACGGVLIFAIGLELLELKKVRVANFLPALFIAPLVVYLTSLLK